MGTPSWIDLFVGPLERLGVRYMVTGSIASMLYGEPRLTLDLDVVVELDAAHAAAFLACFPESEFHRPPLKVAQAEATRGVRSMLAAGVGLDRAFLDAEIAQRGLGAAWDEVQGSA